MNINSTKLLIALFFSSAFALKAQQSLKHLSDGHKCEFSGQMQFDQDSLIGFDETLEWQKAIASGYEVKDEKIAIAIAKRNFIDFKYGYKQMYTGGVNQVQSGCTNVDFEAGSAVGWTIVQGDNINSTTHQMGTLSTTTQTLICNPGYSDPNGVPITGTSPLGGKFLRLGKTVSGGTAYKASQTFTVTAANSVFIYAYAIVLEDGSHTCAQQPYFSVSFKDCSGNAIPCGQYDVIAGGSACSSGVDPSFVTSGSYSYRQWRTAAFDLTSQIGSCVTIDFQVAGCVIAQGAHTGYCYIDASCQPMTLNLNGTEIPVGQTNNSICGAATTNTLCAPAGFSYSWTGPGVTGQTGQCINTSGTGTYSVSLGQTGASCFNPILYSTFSSIPSPTITASLTQPVCALPAGTATMNITGGTGPYSYSWTPAAPSNSVNANLPAGTSYTVSATDANGCSGSTTFSVDPYPPAPAYTLSVVPGYTLSCSSPSTTITFAPTNTNTTAQWDGPSGTITATNVVVTTPGVYTYTTINTVSTCSLTGTINITGTLNLPVMTSTVTQPNCASPFGSATVTTNNGATPYTYSWSPTVAAPSDTINTNLPPGTIYTVSVTDNLGCTGVTSFSVNNFAGPPSYTLSNTGLALSCASPTTALTFASTNANTTANWDGPSGTITATTVVVSSPGVYTYTAINTVSTCSITGSMTVTGTPNFPVMTSTVTQPTCAAPVSNATISVTGGVGPYTYNWSPNVTSGSDTIKTNLPLGTTYTVSVMDNTGCSSLTTFSVNSFSGAPSYTLDANPGLLLSCTTPSTTLTFAPTNTNTSTSWTGPSGVISGTTAVVTPTAAGTYSYIALNTVSTCSLAGTMVVTVDTIKPTAVPSVSCNVTTISVNATSAPGVNLNWIAPTTPTTNIGNPATSTAIGVYTLTATDPNNGCVQTYTASTSVPPITVVTSPTTNVLTCTTQTIQATTSSSSASVTVTWNNGVTTSTVNPYPITANGTYTTVVQVLNGCSSQSVITVNTNTAVNVSINPSSVLITCATGSVNLTANSSVGGPYVYGWTPSSTTYTGTQFPVISAGNYTVVALNTANGCTATASQAIAVQSINASFVASTYQGQMPLPVTFTNTSIGSNPAGTNYTWDFGDGNGLSSNDTTVNHLYNSQGYFPVVLTAKNGFCTDTAMRYIKVDLISVFEVPNVFTPNGDGKNDVFTFHAINMGEINLTIFDRWGLKMFEATDSGNIKWDGKNKGGHTVTDGTYFYIIKATGLDDAKYDLKGTVNVFQ